jgi:hypothetical protein
MKPNNASQPKPKPRRRRFILFGLLGLVVVLVLLVALLPSLVSTSAVRKLVMGRVNAAIEGQAEVGQWSWGWISGVHVRDLHLQNLPGLAQLTVKGIQVKPGLRSLFSGQLALRQTVIDQPRVTLSNVQPKTEANSPGRAGPASQASVRAPLLPISQLDLEIRDGIVEVLDEKKGKITLSGINSQVSLDTAQGRGGLSLAMVVEGKDTQGSLQADLDLDQVQWREWSFKDTSGSVTVDVNTLELGSLEALLSLGGLDVDLKGTMNAQLKGEIRQGELDTVMGTVEAHKVDVTGPAFSGDRLASTQVDMTIDAKREQQTIQLNSLSLSCDWLKTDVQGSLPAGSGIPSLSGLSESGIVIQGDFALDVAQLASQLPHHLSLKEKTRLTKGRATGHFDLAQAKIAGDFRLEELAGQVDQTLVSLSESIQGRVELTTQDMGKFRVEALSLSSSFARVQATGDSERIEYSEWLNLEKMQAELGQFLDIGDYTLKGQLSGEGVAHLGDHGITVSGTSVLENLDLTVPDGNSVSETQVQVSYATVYDAEQDVLRVAGLFAKADWGEMGIRDMRIGFKEDQMQGNVYVKALQLQHLLPYIRAFSSAPSGMNASGLAQADCRIQKTDGVIQFVTDNTVIEQFELHMPEKQAFKQSSMSVALQARVNPMEKAINIESFQLISPEIKITKGQFQHQVQADSTTVQATVDCEYDLQAMAEFVAPLLPAGLDMAGHRIGHVSFYSTYPSAQTQALWRSAQGEARFGFDRATYQGLDFGPTDVNAVFAQGMLEIEPFQTEVNQGQLAFACRTHFQQMPARIVMSEPRQVAQGIHLTPETTQRLFRYVNPLFANLSDVEGKANFYCEKLILPLDPNAQDEIEVVGTISMDDIHVQGSGLLNDILAGLQMNNLHKQTLKMHPTAFVLREGVLRYDDMQIDVGDNPINFSGAIGLDESLDMRVKTPYTSSGKTVRVGDPDQGQRVTVALTGTLDRPVIDMGSALDQLLQIGIQRGLQELFKL